MNPIVEATVDALNESKNETISKVDYIMLKTGYSSRLVYFNGRKYRKRFVLPDEGGYIEVDGDYESTKELDYGKSYYDDNDDRELKDAEYEKNETNEEDYEVVCILDVLWGKNFPNGGNTIFNDIDYQIIKEKFIDPSKQNKKHQYKYDFGTIIFKHKNKDGKQIKMNLSDYIPLARSINIEFCACYTPLVPYHMEIQQKDGIRILIVEYDTESG
jgi:hypothetical protein